MNLYIGHFDIQLTYPYRKLSNLGFDLASISIIMEIYDLFSPQSCKKNPVWSCLHSLSVGHTYRKHTIILGFLSNPSQQWPRNLIFFLDIQSFAHSLHCITLHYTLWVMNTFWIIHYTQYIWTHSLYFIQFM